MKRITQEELNEILRLHKMWLGQKDGGKRANLSHADLRFLDLSYSDLSYADLSFSDLRFANLSYANFSYVDLDYTNLSCADLSYVNLSHVDLRSVDLDHANLSCAQGLKSNIDFLVEHFEKTEEGYIAYKTFGSKYAPPDEWNITKGSILNENVNFNRTNDCGNGINVAPLDWVKSNYKGTIWKCLIRWDWLAGICCPYNSDGKIRCERVELIEPVEE